MIASTTTTAGCVREREGWSRGRPRGTFICTRRAVSYLAGVPRGRSPRARPQTDPRSRPHFPPADCTPRPLFFALGSRLLPSRTPSPPFAARCHVLVRPHDQDLRRFRRDADPRGEPHGPRRPRVDVYLGPSEVWGYACVMQLRPEGDHLEGERAAARRVQPHLHLSRDASRRVRECRRVGATRARVGAVATRPCWSLLSAKQARATCRSTKP